MWTNQTTINKQNFLFLNKKTLNYVYLTIAIGLIGVVCGIFLTILKTTFWFTIVGFSALILGGLYGLIVVFKSQKKVVGSTLLYTFNETDFTVKTEQGESTISYISLTKILQDDKTLLLFISKNQAYIVDKTNLDSACIEHITLSNLQKDYADIIQE